MKLPILSILLAAGCATQQPATQDSASSAYPPPASEVTRQAICEADDARVIFGEAPAGALILAGNQMLAAVGCGGTRIRGADFACHAVEADLYYDTSNRTGWLVRNGSRLDLRCRLAGDRCGTSRYCLCSTPTKLVRIDTAGRTADLFEPHQSAVTGNCLSVASAGADTRCVGPGYSLEYESHDGSRAVLTEANGNFWLTCAGEPEP